MKKAKLVLPRQPMRRALVNPFVDGEGFDIFPRKNTPQQEKDFIRQRLYIRQAQQHAIRTTTAGSSEREALIKPPWLIEYLPVPYRNRERSSSSTPHKEEINDLIHELYLMWRFVPIDNKHKSHWERIFKITKHIAILMLKDNGVKKPKVSIDIEPRNSKSRKKETVGITYRDGSIVLFDKAFVTGVADLVDTVIHEVAHSIYGNSLRSAHNEGWHRLAVSLGMIPGYSTHGGCVGGV